MTNDANRKSSSAASRFVAAARNPKLAPVIYEPTATRPRPAPAAPYVCSTMTSIAATCPGRCRFKGHGCYAQAGFLSFTARKLDDAAIGLSSEDVIREEVRLIDRAFHGGAIPQDGACGGRDLRLHVVGDVGNTAGAKMLGQSATRWRQRGGGRVWTYTHCWRFIPRSAWGPDISVMASVEKPAEIEQARRRGYASVIVVEAFPDGAKAFRLAGSTTRIVPCPAETREGMTCIRCRLCLDRDLLTLGRAIGLRPHGPGARAAAQALRASKANGV
jgi:hypothetical protein